MDVRDLPEGCIPAWTLNDVEKNELLKGMKYLNNYTTNYFKLLEHLHDGSVCGYLGHEDLVAREGVEKFHRHLKDGNESYFIDYAKRKPVYVTFDRIAVFRLQYILAESGRPLKWYWRIVAEPKPVVRGQAFMIMPFGNKLLDAFYCQHVKDMLRTEADVNIIRSDDTKDNDFVAQTLLFQIETSELIIADATTANKNVFYEIGYADAIGKELIIIQSETEEKIFFDKAHARVIKYRFDDPEPFRRQLLETVKAVRAKIDAAG